jgi:GAF domain-containing protein
MLDKQELYRELTMQARAICEGEPSIIANLANTSAILFDRLADINWAGFYLIASDVRGESEELVLGPFQGKAACVRIPLGRGVCGTAASLNQAQLVEDVHQFDGHIACDAASNSEVVIPVVVEQKVVAVLDIDSPSIARFDKQDLVGLQDLVSYLETIWPR